MTPKIGRRKPIYTKARADPFLQGRTRVRANYPCATGLADLPVTRSIRAGPLVEFQAEATQIIGESAKTEGQQNRFVSAARAICREPAIACMPQAAETLRF